MGSRCSLSSQLGPCSSAICFLSHHSFETSLQHPQWSPVMKSKGAFLLGLLCFDVILPSCPIPLYSPTPILPWPFSGCFLSPFLSVNCVLNFSCGGFWHDCNLQTMGFFLTVNPIFPAEPRISYWHLKINLEKSNLSSIHHPLIQSTALELHISVIGSAILSVIHLEISVISHLLSVLLLSSKCLLITKDKPKLFNPVSKALSDLPPFTLPPFTSSYSVQALQASQRELLVISWTHPMQPHTLMACLPFPLPEILPISAYRNQAYDSVQKATVLSSVLV